jgi:ribosome-associated protein
MEELLQAANNRLTESPSGPRLPGTEDVKTICKLLEEHKGGDVTALDLRELQLWTDFFIIATVTSSAQLQGLLRHIAEFAGREDLLIQRRTGREKSGGWSLVDMGTAVIHLMTAQSREFYELEGLWSSAAKIYP